MLRMHQGARLYPPLPFVHEPQDGQAGALVVLRECMGFHRSWGAKWILCWLAAGGC